MVAIKEIAVGTVLILLLALPAASLRFNVDVAGDAEAATYELNYKELSEGLQEINITAENVGSIGCEYRLKGKFSYDNSTETVYSQGTGIWPGESSPLKLHYIPSNHTGEVSVDLNLEYCGISENLRDFNYSSEAREFNDNKLESTTLSSNSSSARVRVASNEGVLVPEETPAGWKVASSTIDRNKAALDYEPSLFSRDKQIAYKLVKNGSVLGTTEIDLEPKERVLEKIPGGLIGIITGLSVLLNLLFIFSKFRARN